MSILALPRPPAVPGGAMLLSVAVHAAALFLLPGLARHAEEQLPPIVATLRFLPAVQAAVAPAAPKQARPVPLPRAARTPALPPPSGAAEAAPAHREAPPAAVAESAAPSASPQPAPLAATSATAARAATAPTPGAVPDSVVLDDYSRALSELLARRQQYPRLAALRGWEGEVRLRLRVASKGNLVAVQVVHSSGHEVLDQHALQMIQAAALPSPPDSLGDREIQVVVPIHYKLQKPT